MNSVCSTAGRPLFAPGGPMRVHKLAWLGTRTDNPEATVAFFRSLLGLSVDHEEPDFVVLRLPDGAKVEVFGPGSDYNRHFTTGPVAGFLVDDVEAATAELRSAGVEILLEPEVDDSGNAWVHFRAPDGNIYELTQDPGVSRPHWTVKGQGRRGPCGCQA